MAARRYIFAGGGTGGHLYPGIAVAEELLRIESEARIIFACSDRPIDRQILDETPYAVVPQPVRPIPRSLRQAPAFLAAYLRSSRLARDLLRDLHPAAVFGLGGFAAAPVVRRAAAVGIPTALLNPDAVPGKANLYLAHRAGVIFTQFESTTDSFNRRDRPKIRAVGCPVRGELMMADREESLRHFQLRPQLRTLLVFGGSQSARTINEAVIEIRQDLAKLRQSWQLLHVAGPAAAPAAEDAYRGAGLTARVLDYCHAMAQAYAAADLVVARAGASAVAELTATATPAVLMPYPHHGDLHQRLNAEPLAAAGAAVVCDDADDVGANAAALRAELLPILRDPQRLELMRREAARGTATAAKEIARYLARL